MRAQFTLRHLSHPHPKTCPERQGIGDPMKINSAIRSLFYRRRLRQARPCVAMGQRSFANRRLAEVVFNNSNMAARDSRAEKPVQGGRL